MISSLSRFDYEQWSECNLEFQKLQIYQRFAGSRQEVFVLILIYGQTYFHKYVCCKLAVEFYSGMGYTVFERS